MPDDQANSLRPRQPQPGTKEKPDVDILVALGKIALVDTGQKPESRCNSLSSLSESRLRALMADPLTISIQASSELMQNSRKILVVRVVPGHSAMKLQEPVVVNALLLHEFRQPFGYGSGVRTTWRFDLGSQMIDKVIRRLVVGHMPVDAIVQVLKVLIAQMEFVHHAGN